MLGTDPDGNYEIYYIVEQTANMHLGTDYDDLVFYMGIDGWQEGSPYQFSLAPEGNENVNINLYPVNSFITANLTWEGNDVDSFMFHANSDEIFSFSNAYTDAEGNALIPVYSGAAAPVNYWVQLNTWETPVPEGYAVNPEYSQPAIAGETVYFTFYDPTGINNNGNLISKYKLNQNYPNPFNPSTTITFSLKRSETVTLTVYNLLGEKVVTLIDGMKMNQGENIIDFRAAELASGIYFYTLETPSFKQTKKMTLLK